MFGSTSSSAIPMSCSPTPKHDVFLSFRGEDTRDNFISHLYAELGRKKIETFMDHKLGRGEEISPALYKAIEESMIYVVILSENYASSTWCLDELTKILECREKYGRDVIPVFYKVDPSNVRNQRNSYAEAFVKHQRRFKDDQLDSWKKALTQVAGLSGWDSQVTRPEHRLIEDIVKDILRKLNLNYSFGSDYQGMIGIDKHTKEIHSLLHIESAAVRIIGIWGMGGIGKTTIATAIYHKLATQFSSNTILNVQQEMERFGLDHVRSKYISKISSSRFSFSNDGRIKWKKALLVLDNVNNSAQLKDLIGPGSNIAPEDYAELSEKIVNYAKGVPLALKVLGFLLCGRTKEAWESQLRKLDRLPENDIFKVLKLSYEGLDEEQKDIFLDIACFYRGHLENVVAQTLDSCGFSAHIGMDILKDRCLISVSEGRIVMHDLIQEMGHEIVRQQCVNAPGKRSRLWKPEEIYQVLKKNKGTDAIQCIFLDICKIEKVQLHAKTFRKMDNLRMMQFYNSHGCSKGSNIVLPAFFNSLPDDLKFLHWDDFSQKSLPLDFFPKNLVKLYMPHSHLNQLWQTDKDLPNLKTPDLRGSQNLIQIPDLAQCPNIEEVILSHCPKLSQVYSSSFLCKLKCLWLNGCVSLRSLHIPCNILQRTSGLLVLHGCHNLEMFSVSNAKMEVQLHGCSTSMFRNIVPVAKQSGKRLDSFCSNLNQLPLKVNFRRRLIQNEASFTLDPLDYAELNKEPKDNIELLNFALLREGSPSSFPSLNALCWLDLSNCEALFSLPIDLFKLKFLRRLYLSGCLSLETFPEIEEDIESLAVLILDETSIKELPSSLHRLVNLEELSLYNCQSLETIPSSIGSLRKLSKLNLTFCESLETFPSSIFKLKLTKLNLTGCLMLKIFPEILEPAETFVHINLTRTAIKELPSSLENLVGLQTLWLKLCTELVSIPNSIVNLNHLSELDCSGCCSIVNLPEIIAHLSSLKSLHLSDCRKLESFIGRVEIGYSSKITHSYGHITSTLQALTAAGSLMPTTSLLRSANIISHILNQVPW
ncbi:hypothetical protein TSUD_193680 [Trifolium subterraneum]|uniref:TIR domain-containing protein n=1 Tax=Trifolium subterraneum TaxID=3900 RepID=A0A2Z6M2A4_TRISU|nr:hypothetical protein TSUD_193680 [Trifolium subterraneum]